MAPPGIIGGASHLGQSSAAAHAALLRPDPHREAQELIALQRPLMPPQPRPTLAAGSLLGPTGPVPMHQSRRGTPMSGSEPGAPQFSSPMPLAPDHPFTEAFPGRGARRLLERAGRPRAGSSWRGSMSARGPASRVEKERRMLAAMERQQPSGQSVAQEAVLVEDHRKRNVLLREVRQQQGRWPAEARWAGHPPDFIRERFDRLGTLANERADGRTLPHERAEKWWWPGA